MSTLRTASLATLLVACSSASTITPPTDSAVRTDSPIADASSDVPSDRPPPTDAGTCPVTPSSEPGVVATDRGLVRGVTANGVRSYRGIPYAAPPTGDLRWRAPSPGACWTGIRDASAFGAICPQLDAMGMPTGSEDCLTLNVWTPDGASSGPLPVMVFIHGGGNNQGSSAVGGDTPLYDGKNLAARGAVVVTINYRLGALGFMSHPALDRESTDGTSGNYGLHDALAALRWVQSNIRGFGGDPARVMLFGESAGGVNVCALLASPLSRGLFSRALIESGGCGVQTRAAANAAADRLIAATMCNGADPIACLRARSPSSLLQALPPDVTGLTPTDFNVSLDGRVVPMVPTAAIAAGAHQHMPVVIGSNRDEAGRMVPTTITTEAQYRTAATAYLSQYALTPTQVEAVLAAYPASAYDSPRLALVALATDTRWTCPARGYLRALRAGQTESAYRYFFTRGLDPASAPLLSRVGAYHAIELFYVFGALTLGGYRPTSADLSVAEAVQNYWLRFAQTGDPNLMSAPAWPAYDAMTDPFMQLDVSPMAGAGVRTALCDALAAALR